MYRNLQHSLKPPRRSFITPKHTQGSNLVDLLLPYQKCWVEDPSSLMLCEKGRQIGFSWCDSLKAVLDGINGVSTYYTSYNFETTKNYIRTAYKWGKAINYVVGDKLIDEEQFSYKLKFSSGAEIETLAGNATNLRDKKGNIVIDEAAFRDNLKDIIDAAMAILIHGGKIRIFSTHFGIDNYFNDLCQNAAEKHYSFHRNPFKKAVNEGLYKRICFKSGINWSQQLEDMWVADLYEMYGLASSQELDCIPSDSSGLSIFKMSNFTFVDYLDVEHEIVFTIRSWDLASTERGGCFSVGSKMHLLNSGKILWESSEYGQWGAVEGDNAIEKCAIIDNIRCMILIEREGGSHSMRWEEQIKARLDRYLIEFVKPIGDKLIRAVPLANDCTQGNFLIADTLKNRELAQEMTKFTAKSKPLITDLVDSLTLGRNYLKEFENSMLGL